MIEVKQQKEIDLAQLDRVSAGGPPGDPYGPCLPQFPNPLQPKKLPLPPIRN